MKTSGFHVRIEREAYDKMLTYVDMCPTEVSGFGRTVQQRDGILITDAFLIDQEVSSATTDMDPEAIFNATMEESMQGKDTSDWGCWWHSHAYLETFFSTVDAATIQKLRADTPLVSIVFNKHRRYSCRVDIYHPFEMTLHDVPLEVVYTASASMKEQVTKDLQQKVRHRQRGRLLNRHPYLLESAE